MKIYCRIDIGCGEIRYARAVIHDLNTRRYKIISASDRLLVFEIYGRSLIRRSNALPLVAINCLESYVSRKQACKGRIAQKRRLKELRKMWILTIRLKHTA